MTSHREVEFKIGKDGRDRDRKPHFKTAMTLLLFTLALAACNMLQSNYVYDVVESTSTAAATSTETPTATLPAPTSDYVSSDENNLATRAARWDATRTVEPYGSTPWAERLNTFPDWYKAGVIGMTGSTTTPGWKHWYQCNGIAVYKTLLRGPDGGKYVLISNLTNEHCSFEEFDESNSSPLRLSLRGLNSFSESYSSFMDGTILTNVDGSIPIDMAFVSVLASSNPVVEQIIPVGVEKFLPPSAINTSELVDIQGLGIPWSNSHSFSAFSGLLGSFGNANYYITYDINSISGLSGTAPLYEHGNISGIPGLVSGHDPNSVNISYIIANPQNIQDQIESAYYDQLEHMKTLGYVVIP